MLESIPIEGFYMLSGVLIAADEIFMIIIFDRIYSSIKKGKHGAGKNSS